MIKTFIIISLFFCFGCRSTPKINETWERTSTGSSVQIGDNIIIVNTPSDTMYNNDGFTHYSYSILNKITLPDTIEIYVKNMVDHNNGYGKLIKIDSYTIYSLKDNNETGFSYMVQEKIIFEDSIACTFSRPPPSNDIPSEELLNERIDDLMHFVTGFGIIPRGSRYFYKKQTVANNN